MKKFFKSFIGIAIIILLLTIIFRLVNIRVHDSALNQPIKTEISNKFKTSVLEKNISDEKDTNKQKDDLKQSESEESKQSFNTNEANISNVSKSIKNQTDIMVLVNKTNTFNSDFVPSNLVKANVSFAAGTPKEEMMMRKEAADALKNMFTAASKSGIKLLGVSGYRSYESQREIYNQKLNSNGRAYVDNYVANPGQSEHQTGLAMDVGREIPKNSKFVDFGETKEGIWLKNNAHNYGFILRYPRGKENITGYNYEPWHIRYVGEKAAKEMKSKGLVLEEYLESTYASKTN